MDDEMQFFRNLSAKHGMPLQFVIKEFHVMDLLENIVAKAGGEALVFKGGTALNRAYAAGESRFSEDLDFDYISRKPLKSKIKFLDSIMKMKNYDIDKSRLFRNRLRFDCFFRNEMGKKDVVRAEFNLTFSKPVGRIEKRSVVSGISGKSVAGVSVYRLEDLLARKILALHNRMEGKDIFDVANFIRKADAKGVKKSLSMILRHEKSMKSAADVISGCSDKLSAADVKEVKALTNNYIPVPIRPEWHGLVETLKMELEKMT